MKVFGTDVTLDGMAKAIASFERTALSGELRLRQVRGRRRPGDETFTETFKILTDWPEARDGPLRPPPVKDDDPYEGRHLRPAKLKKANCTACHAGANFTDEMFHNIGVGTTTRPASSPTSAAGRSRPSGRRTVKAEKRGSFKTPTIRDIARTGPYMHDGSEKTLEQVVEYYNKGGNKNPSLDAEMKPLNLTDAEKSDLVEFMKSLAGTPVVVAVPALPAGPDGKSPDPTAALNKPSAKTAFDAREVHGAVTAR